MDYPGQVGIARYKLLDLHLRAGNLGFEIDLQNFELSSIAFEPYNKWSYGPFKVRSEEMQYQYLGYQLEDNKFYPNRFTDYTKMRLSPPYLN